MSNTKFQKAKDHRTDKSIARQLALSKLVRPKAKRSRGREQADLQEVLR